MAKYFKCIDCGYRFQAEDYAETCPSCGSDNITPDKGGSHVLSVILTAVIGLSFGVGAGYLAPTASNNNRISKPMTQYASGNSNNNVAGSQSLTPTRISNVSATRPSNSTNGVLLREADIPDVTDTPDEEPVVLVNSTPSITSTTGPSLASNGSFVFKVVASVESGDKLEYELKDEDGLTVVSSDDGSFSNIKSSEDGSYRLVVTNNRTGESLEQPVSGFKKPASQAIPKITKQELQATFDSQRKPSNFNDKFASNYVLTVNGLEAGEPKPDRIEEIFNRLTSGAWTRAVVNNVTYDDMNKIKRLVLDVIY